MLGNNKNQDFDRFINQMTVHPIVSPRNQPLAPLNPNHRNVSPRKAGPSPLIPERPISPNRISHTRKPNVSPTRSPRRQVIAPRKNISRGMEQSQQYFCVNESHPTKKAEFFICVQNEEMYYCNKCAVQAASQGFTIKSINQNKGKVMPYYPQYNSNPKYKQLMEILNVIKTLDEEFIKMSDQRKINEHYENQEKLLQNFYQQIETTVERMRNDHLSDLEEERQRKVKESSNWQMHMKEHVEELEEAWIDISQNVQQIVEDVDLPSFNDCMQEYQGKCELFEHKLEQFSEEFPQTTYEERQLNEKVKIFQRKLREIWEDHAVEEQMRGRQRSFNVNNISNNVERNQTVKAERSQTVRRVQTNLAKQEKEDKGAFRTLFNQGEGQSEVEERLPEASPQFKNF